MLYILAIVHLSENLSKMGLLQTLSEEQHIYD